MGDYRFEKLSDDNLADLAGIYENAYGKPANLDSFRKKFDTSVFGHKHMGFIAYSDTNEAAAFYGVFPCFLKFKGQKIYAAQSGDTMTHKNHQGKGLFVALAKKTYEYAESVGIKVVFGFPNENSYPGFVRKLNWDHYEDMHAYIIRVPCLPWIRGKKWLGIKDETQYRFFLRLISSIPRGEPFESSVINEEFGGIDRSAEFFTYKMYAQNFLLRIAGKSLWIKLEGMFLLVGDMERCEGAAFDKVMSALKRICFWTGIPYIRFHCSPGVFWEGYFSSKGEKLERGYPVGYVKWNTDLDMRKIKFTAADNDTF